MMNRSFVCLSALMVSCAFSGATAGAVVIMVNNASFETLPSVGLPNACGSSCFYSDDLIPGWTSGVNTGQFQPGTQDGNSLFFNTLSQDGTINSAYANSGTMISQTVATTVQAGVVYTLLVDLGRRTDTAFAASADLLINGIQYAATGTTPAPGKWSTFTATYTGLSADIGSAINIELQDHLDIQANFDNVRLSDSTVAPEPATAAIISLGLVFLGALAGRRGRPWALRRPLFFLEVWRRHQPTYYSEAESKP